MAAAAGAGAAGDAGAGAGAVAGSSLAAGTAATMALSGHSGAVDGIVSTTPAGTADMAASEWSKLWSAEHGAFYYLNSATGESSWVAPAGFAESATPAVAPAVAHAQTWAKIWSAEHGVYYYTNSTTGESSWEVPADYVDPDTAAAAAVAASTPASATDSEPAATSTVSATDSEPGTGSTVSAAVPAEVTDASTAPAVVSAAVAAPEVAAATAATEAALATTADDTAAAASAAAAISEATIGVDQSPAAPAAATAVEPPSPHRVVTPVPASPSPRRPPSPVPVTSVVSPTTAASSRATAPSLESGDTGTGAADGGHRAAGAATAWPVATLRQEWLNKREKRGEPFDDEVEFNAFIAHFLAIDTDRTGFLHRDNLAAFAARSGVKLTTADLDDLIDDKDVDGDGRISLREFIAASNRPLPRTQEFFWRRLFAAYASIKLPEAVAVELTAGGAGAAPRLQRGSSISRLTKALSFRTGFKSAGQSDGTAAAGGSGKSGSDDKRKDGAPKLELLRASRDDVRRLLDSLEYSYAARDLEIWFAGSADDEGLPYEAFRRIWG